MKGVVLAGGTGSRLRDLTKVTNKHLLPVGEQPMIRWAVNALLEANVRDLLLVTGIDHVDDFVDFFGNGVQYAVQERAGGIAEALGLARSFAGRQRIAVILADNVYGGSIAPTIENFQRQSRGARVLLAHVRETEHLRHLGVPTIENGRIIKIEEKPVELPGHHAVTGLYCYGPDVFEVIEGLVPSARGELEITDVNNYYVREGTLEFDYFPGYWGDAGESVEAYYEVIDRVRRPFVSGTEIEVFPIERHRDLRGWLAEIAKQSRLPKSTQQTNLSFSRQGTIRGLHFHKRGQDDLFVCLSGRARVVALNRDTNDTFCVDIGDDNFAAVYVPGNLAHGFEALTDAVMLYHVSEEYNPSDPDEHGIPWDDPRVFHLWSTQSPILSERDSRS